MFSDVSVAARRFFTWEADVLRDESGAPDRRESLRRGFESSIIKENHHG
jgi:hypothetical protein